MNNEKILEDIEYEVFKAFSRKLEPNTKHDYLSKIILFKKFLEDKELVYANKEDCKKFIEYVQTIYKKSTCEKVYSYLHSFYNYVKVMKNKLHLDTMYNSDIYAPLNECDANRLYDIEDAKTLVINSLKPLGKAYLEVVNKLFDSRTIDVYPTENKGGGGFSTGCYDVLPYILLNFNANP